MFPVGHIRVTMMFFLFFFNSIIIFLCGINYNVAFSHAARCFIFYSEASLLWHEFLTVNQISNPKRVTVRMLSFLHHRYMWKVKEVSPVLVY